MKIKGKTVLVMRALSGNKEAIAKAAAKMNVTLILLARNEEALKRVESIVNTIKI